MKKIILLFFCAFFSIHIYAQDCLLPMMVDVKVPEDSQIPSSTKTLLQTRLTQAVTQNGMGGDKYAQFCVVAVPHEVSKSVLGGTRPLVTLQLGIDVFVGNILTGEKFSATTITANGSGRNERQAFTNAINSIKGDNTQIKTLVTSAYKRIMHYYDTQISDIIKQANAYALREQYEEAFGILGTVPPCINRYDEVESAFMNIALKYESYDCSKKLAAAKSAWNAGQDKMAAQTAGAYLALIKSGSVCQDEVDVLQEEIKATIGEEKMYQRQLVQSAIELESMRIESAKAIGVAFGEHQKQADVIWTWSDNSQKTLPNQ